MWVPNSARKLGITRSRMTVSHNSVYWKVAKLQWFGLISLIDNDFNVAMIWAKSNSVRWGWIHYMFYLKRSSCIVRPLLFFHHDNTDRPIMHFNVVLRGPVLATFCLNLIINITNNIINKIQVNEEFLKITNK